jgi:hypothetical protein
MAEIATENIRKAAAVFLAGLFFASEAWAGSPSLLLRVPFKEGAMAEGIFPDGSAVSLGRVRALPDRTNWPAYTASKWGTPGTVCATAVNAIHILVDVEKGRGRIFSIVPTVTVAPAAPPGAFFSIESPAGTGLFGAFAPVTGSKVFVESADARKGLRPFAGREKKIALAEEEALLIESPLPDSPDTWMTDIENRPGGRVWAWMTDGARVVARVVRPVGGVGRFGGTEFQSVGRIRAAHAGVIDVATSPRGKVGGIQIMPLTHALTSVEMAGAWAATQWMIVAPAPGHKPLEGTPPLFKGLVPGTEPGGRLADIWSTYGRKPLVLGRFDGGPWRALPPVSGKADDALRSLTHLRIYYPFWNEPGGGSPGPTPGYSQ